MFCLNYWAYFRYSETLVERTCLIWSFLKICFDRRRRLEVKQWCYSRSAERTDDRVDTTFFFLCLGHGQRPLTFILSHIWGRRQDHARETQDGKVLLVGWCNVAAICWAFCFSFLSSTLARSDGDYSRHLYRNRSLATSKLDHCLAYNLFSSCKRTLTQGQAIHCYRTCCHNACCGRRRCVFVGKCCLSASGLAANGVLLIQLTCLVELVTTQQRSRTPRDTVILQHVHFSVTTQASEIARFHPRLLHISTETRHRDHTV